jgi:NAD kinase
VSAAPRAVLVTRQTDFTRLLAAHATRGQAEFFLRRRGQDILTVERARDKIESAINQVRQSLPEDWPVAQVTRHELDRFIFAEGDFVFAIGQDGLVANLAKYLSGQPVFGVNPDPDVYEGALAQLDPSLLKKRLGAVLKGSARIERRTMLKAQIDDGPQLFGLNEIFIGHRSHQSARYNITLGENSESQSSSGVIVATGTGATGWARSIMTATRNPLAIGPEEETAVFFAREPWPSKSTGCEMAYGMMSRGQGVTLLSHMNDGGVVFADGMEEDRLEFSWGKSLRVSIADKTLNLVSGS